MESLFFEEFVFKMAENEDYSCSTDCYSDENNSDEESRRTYENDEKELAHFRDVLF